MNDVAIHDAASKGDLEKVRQLIEAGVHVDTPNEDGQTPLHTAARCGQYEVARLLVNSGCLLYFKDLFGLTPLHFTSFDIARLILDQGEPDGAGLDAADEDGKTPLMNAAESGNEEVAGLLIRAGADVNRSDGLKRTALHWTVAPCRAPTEGQNRIIQILLEKEGLHLSNQDVFGNTPLHLACQHTCREAVKQLLDAGADTNLKNICNDTALNIVIKSWYLFEGQVEIIKLLVQKGAFFEPLDYECMSRKPILKDKVLKDVKLCTLSIVNKFNYQSLSALNSIPYFARRLPIVDNFKLEARHIDEVENLVKCEIERNTFCNVVKIRPIALSALCVQSLITCQSDKKQAASTD